MDDEKDDFKKADIKEETDKRIDSDFVVDKITEYSIKHNVESIDWKTIFIPFINIMREFDLVKQKKCDDEKNKYFNANFSDALIELKSGGKIARYGWVKKWICYCPQSNFYNIPFNYHWNKERGVLPCIVMKTENDKIVPWVASQEDILADDWGKGR